MDTARIERRALRAESEREAIAGPTLTQDYRVEGREWARESGQGGFGPVTHRINGARRPWPTPRARRRSELYCKDKISISGQKTWAADYRTLTIPRPQAWIGNAGAAEHFPDIVLSRDGSRARTWRVR